MDNRIVPKDDLRSQRQALLDQLKRIQEQKLDVERQIQRLNLQVEAPAKNAYQKPPVAAPAPSASGLKRPVPAQSTDTRDVKRSKLDKKAAAWSACSNILRMCRKPTQAVWFAKPVNPGQDGVPDYLTIVTHPMDFSTIESKLKGRKYSTPLEFRNDMRLVFDNCRLYTSDPTRPVRKDCEHVSELFEKEWRAKAVEAKWADASGGDAIVAHQVIATRSTSLSRRVRALQCAGGHSSGRWTSSEVCRVAVLPLLPLLTQ
jgi:hypothetical protein